MERKREHPARLVAPGLAPLLAGAALVTHLLWVSRALPDAAAWVTPVVAAAALVAAGSTAFVLRSRPLVAVAVASFGVAALTLVLWWDAIWQIAESS